MTYTFQAFIDCPVCASEAEKNILKNKEILSCSFDFIHNKLTISSTLSRDEVIAIIKKSSDELVLKDEEYNYTISASIDCPVCASEAECSILKNKDIKSCSFDFMNKKINITTHLNRDEVIDLIKRSSDEIIINEDKKLAQELILDATIDCPNCARKVEDALKANPYIDDANFDFLKKKLYVKTNLESSEVMALAKEADEDILFVDKTEKIEKQKEKVMYLRLLLSILFIILAKAIAIPYLSIIAYLISGYDILFKAVKNILKGKAMDENFLMSIATIGALFLGTFEEAAAVMIFYQTGETLQARSVRNSRKSISALMDIKADITHLVQNDSTLDVPTSTVNKGSIIMVKSGERIPLDGVVIKGSSEIDYKALNGESVPTFVENGSSILSGGINGRGTLHIKVTTPYKESTVNKILSLMENSKEKKTKSEAFITTFSRYYTPIVCILSLTIAFLPPLLNLGTFQSWLYKGLTLLVISCPCALVISIPLSYFSATGAYAKKGILIKNSMVIQNLANVDTICFDKTGTLTKGEFEIVKIETQLDKDEVLSIAASLENGSTHPIGKAILAYYKGQFKEVSNLKELSGIGLSGTIGNDEYTFGNGKVLNKVDNSNSEYTTSYLLKNGKLIATFYIADTIKDEAEKAIANLHNLGLDKIVMLSGDRDIVAKKVSEQLHLDQYKAQLLPQDKLAQFEALQARSIKAFVGDGINDSPVLARADIGISMGQVGSDAAIEASDMVILTDDLIRIPDAIKLARQTQTIVKENIYFSLGIKLFVMILSIMGYGNMWLAIFADVGVSLLATINAMRTMLNKK